MKLIIDIPEERFEGIRWAYKGSTQCDYLYRLVANGTPLDDVKAEIEKLSNANPSYWHSGDMVEREEVLEILDNIGKADSE